LDGADVLLYFFALLVPSLEPKPKLTLLERFRLTNPKVNLKNAIVYGLTANSVEEVPGRDLAEILGSELLALTTNFSSVGGNSMSVISRLTKPFFR